jgi:hypothetical protein
VRWMNGTKLLGLTQCRRTVGAVKIVRGRARFAVRLD